MGQNETGHGGRPQHSLNCVKWFPKGAQPPSTKKVDHVCCGQMAGRIKMQLGTEVGLSPRHTVLDGDPAPSSSPKGHTPNFPPMHVVAKRLDRSRCHLVGRQASALATLC